jgi:hypothetical protein
MTPLITVIKNRLSRSSYALNYLIMHKIFCWGFFYMHFYPVIFHFPQQTDVKLFAWEKCAKKVDFPIKSTDSVAIHTTRIIVETKKNIKLNKFILEKNGESAFDQDSLSLVMFLHINVQSS